MRQQLSVQHHFWKLLREQRHSSALELLALRPQEHLRFGMGSLWPMKQWIKVRYLVPSVMDGEWSPVINVLELALLLVFLENLVA
jgi:hypothetical protein